MENKAANHRDERRALTLFSCGGDGNEESCRQRQIGDRRDEEEHGLTFGRENDH